MEAVTLAPLGPNLFAVTKLGVCGVVADYESDMLAFGEKGCSPTPCPAGGGRSDDSGAV
ncbi:hypothetical protein [Aquibium oceanicum]